MEFVLLGAHHVDAGGGASRRGTSLAMYCMTMSRVRPTPPPPFTSRLVLVVWHDGHIFVAGELELLTLAIVGRLECPARFHQQEVSQWACISWTHHVILGSGSVVQPTLPMLIF
jgi:hypothetical protein